jgi:hypothetical protein
MPSSSSLDTETMAGTESRPSVDPLEEIAARDLSAGSASAGDRTGRAEARMLQLQMMNLLAGTTPARG